jgi:dihydroorotate dehydrogenase electron transfer subunit
MRLEGDTGALSKPGQFVNVRVGNAYLRRPFSPAAWDKESMTLIYKVVGLGTDWLAHCQMGDNLDLLTGLGRGYDTKLSGSHPLLIGGGIGLPPLYQLAVELILEGKQPRLIMGFGSVEDIFYQQEFAALLPVTIMTVDGSAGNRGLVTDAPLQEEDSYLYACGPIMMLKALCRIPLPGQLSMEERMGCGFGACMGCTINTTKGPQRVCKEGPVFRKEELIW